MMNLWWRQIGASVRMLLLATLVLGVLYPAVGLLLAQALPAQSAGSLVRSGGEVVGSSLIGQQADGPGLFLPRPRPANTTPWPRVVPTSAPTIRNWSTRSHSVALPSPSGSR